MLEELQQLVEEWKGQAQRDALRALATDDAKDADYYRTCAKTKLMCYLAVESLLEKEKRQG